MLCKATGIFMIFSEFFYWLLEGLKLKQFLKQLKRKKKEKKGGGPNWAETGLAGRRSRSRAQRQEASTAEPALFLFFSFSLLFVFFSDWWTPVVISHLGTEDLHEHVIGTDPVL
jgi:hypothetical protein